MAVAATTTTAEWRDEVAGGGMATGAKTTRLNGGSALGRRLPRAGLAMVEKLLMEDNPGYLVSGVHPLLYQDLPAYCTVQTDDSLHERTSLTKRATVFPPAHYP